MNPKVTARIPPHLYAKVLQQPTTPTEVVRAALQAYLFPAASSTVPSPPTAPSVATPPVPESTPTWPDTSEDPDFS